MRRWKNCSHDEIFESLSALGLNHFFHIPRKSPQPQIQGLEVFFVQLVEDAVLGFVGDDGASYLAEVSEGVLTLHSGEAVYVYYPSKEVIPPMTTENAAEELNSVRLHTAKAILEQGEWLGEEGTAFSADEDSIELNGVEMTYRAVSIEAVGGAYELSVEMGGAEQTIRISLVDTETMTYGVEIGGYSFTADGTRFLLDS